jgi:hypothetical protein
MKKEKNIVKNQSLRTTFVPATLIAVCITMIGGLPLSGQAAETPGAVDYFVDNGYGTPVAPIQHPAGEYYRGVTYVAYQGWLEDPYVVAYDHEEGQWLGPFKAGESVLGKDPNTKIDNHGKPAMIIDDAGYIHLVFGGHGGLPSYGKNPLGNTHFGRMKHVASKNPLDISSWEELDNIPPFGTYNQFVKMYNSDLYLFYRHGAHRSNWVYQKSTDNGRSFDPPVSILKTKRCTGILAQDAWYTWFLKGDADEIIAVYNYHLCKDGAVHDGERHNGYYMVMDTKDHVWRNVKGEKLTVPVTKEHADKMTLVVDSGDLWTVRGTAALDSAGHPHVTFTIGEHMGLKHGGPKQMNHFRWTGQKWTDGGCPDLPVAVGDIRISSPDEVSLLLAHKDDEGTGVVSWWHSIDGGQRFNKGDVLINRRKTSLKITSMIRNAHPDARVVVAGKKGSSDFCRMYLLGDHGAIQRPKVEADQLSASDKTKAKRAKSNQ